MLDKYFWVVWIPQNECKLNAGVPVFGNGIFKAMFKIK